MKKTTLLIFIILGLSLSVNLFIAGFYFGDRLHKPHSQKKYIKYPMTTPQISMRRLVSKLPKEKKKLIKPFLEEHKAKLRSLAQEHIQLRMKLYDMMHHENIDIEQFKAALTQEKQLKLQIDMLTSNAFMKILPELTQKERIKLAKSFMHKSRKEIREKMRVIAP